MMIQIVVVAVGHGILLLSLDFDIGIIALRASFVNTKRKKRCFLVDAGQNFINLLNNGGK